MENCRRGQPGCFACRGPAAFRFAAHQDQWGCSSSERFSRSEAENLFKEALAADGHYAPAHLGLARVAAERYEKEAVDLAQTAATEDPKLAAAHELLAYLALEDDDAKTAALEAHRALEISGEALDALAVLASIDWLRGDVTSSTLNAPSANEVGRPHTPQSIPLAPLRAAPAAISWKSIAATWKRWRSIAKASSSIPPIGRPTPSSAST